MVFTENQEALVKNSWEIMKQDVPEISLRFFQTIFEIAPAARGLFSFLKDTDDDEISANDPRVKAHAVVVFKMTRKAAVQLRKTGGVEITEKTLKSLGSVHLKKGITDPQFEVVGEALLRTIKGAVGEEWNDELRIAWTEAYNQLAEVIKVAIKDEAASLD